MLEMVGISLYRGNLQRVPDIPRRWLMPKHKISLKNFKLLLARRSKALSQVRATAATVTTFSNPNQNPNSDSNGQNEALANGSSLGSQLVAVKVRNNGEEAFGKDENRTEPEAVGNSMKKPVVGSDLPIDSKVGVLEKASESVDGGKTSMEKQTEPVTEKFEQFDDREKRKREVEDKLEVLNAKKHNLVLVLKQILNAEEELRRRGSMQELTLCPSVPLQADATNNTDSMVRHITPRMGLEANLGDAEGAETDDLSNCNIRACHVLWTSSMSPSSEFPLRKTPGVQQNMVSLSRASLGAASSPSRSALSGHQGNPMNLPSVSVNGSNCFASSGSPAACGGTSVSRDARQPSPWN